MNCTACGCPGSYALLRGVLCWNRACRNFHSDVIAGSDFSKDGTKVNGDSLEALKRFLDMDDDSSVPDQFLKWKK